MKITRVETFHIRPRWLFLKVTTDAGIVGWGEPVLEGRAQTVETAVREIARTLIGEDPRQIERIWTRYYRGTFYRGDPVLTSALSGLEQALWDILGKHLNVPVHQLLGGRVRDRIRVYGWIDTGMPVGDYVAQASLMTARKGFAAFKFVPVPAMRAIETPEVIDRCVEQVAAIRGHLGRKIDLALDFHGRTSAVMARALARRLEEFAPMFIEEPVLPGSWQALREVAEATTIPIAAGERLVTRWQFRDLVFHRAVSVIQPDVSHCGGMMELKKIAAMAEVEEISVAPHCPLGPIALAACLQVDATLPNFLCQEAMSLGEGLLKVPFEVVDGHIAVPEGPGLGAEPDEEKLRAHLFAGDWETPQLRLQDGSFAEW